MKWSLTISGDEAEANDLLEKIAKVVSNYTKLESHTESKYTPLFRYLLTKTHAGETTLELSLDRIQEIIGAKLPNSAYEYDAFWRDRSRNVGVSIVQSGWQIQALERDSSNRIAKVKLQTPEKLPRPKEVEKAAIVHTLREVGGDKAEAAKLLGIPLRTLYRKLDEFHLLQSSDTGENNSLTEPAGAFAPHEDRQTALKRLLSLQLPVADWEQMEAEIIKGATE
ncbi:MAG: helix-turn-helix domain-containing protein [Candidatus Poribacteria bacterium]|nr:helix-turn-helix domain-containing protein [Candidatus Poribacteria bacterium]